MGNPKTSQEAHNIGRSATLEENVIVLLSAGAEIRFDKFKDSDCSLSARIGEWWKAVSFRTTGDEREIFEFGFQALRIQYEQDRHKMAVISQ